MVESLGLQVHQRVMFEDECTSRLASFRGCDFATLQLSCSRAPKSCAIAVNNSQSHALPQIVRHVPPTSHGLALAVAASHALTDQSRPPLLCRRSISQLARLAQPLRQHLALLPPSTSRCSQYSILSRSHLNCRPLQSANPHIAIYAFAPSRPDRCLPVPPYFAYTSCDRTIERSIDREKS